MGISALPPRPLSLPFVALPFPLRPLSLVPRSLGGTKITDVGAVALAAALEHNAAVTTIRCVAPTAAARSFRCPKSARCRRPCGAADTPSSIPANASHRLPPRFSHSLDDTEVTGAVKSTIDALCLRNKIAAVARNDPGIKELK
jgi:hypothetical protein